MRAAAEEMKGVEERTSGVGERFLLGYGYRIIVRAFAGSDW